MTAAPPRFSAGARTNLPPAPAARAPELDPTARHHHLVAVGPEAARIVARWRSAAVQTSTVTLPAEPALPDDEILRALARTLAAGATVGDRVAMAGPELALYVLRAELLGHGLLAAELIVASTSRDQMRAWCAHCRGILRVPGRPGATIRCPHCRFPVVVRPHFSDRLAAYLAVRADDGVS